MRSFFTALFSALLSWWGLWLIAALDSTMVFFLPLGVAPGGLKPRIIAGMTFFRRLRVDHQRICQNRRAGVH